MNAWPAMDKPNVTVDGAIHGNLIKWEVRATVKGRIDANHEHSR